MLHASAAFKNGVSPGHPERLLSDALKPIAAFYSVGAQNLELKLVWLASLPPDTPDGSHASKHVSVCCTDTQVHSTVYCQLVTSEQLAEPH